MSELYCILILACVKLLFHGFIDKISNSCELKNLYEYPFLAESITDYDKLVRLKIHLYAFNYSSICKFVITSNTLETGCHSDSCFG